MPVGLEGCGPASEGGIGVGHKHLGRRRSQGPSEEQALSLSPSGTPSGRDAAVASQQLPLSAIPSPRPHPASDPPPHPRRKRSRDINQGAKGPLVRPSRTCPWEGCRRPEDRKRGDRGADRGEGGQEAAVRGEA